jgi:ribonuclease VapC
VGRDGLSKDRSEAAAKRSEGKHKRPVVLDASAVLAVFLHEKGWDTVAEEFKNARISAVNVSEVLTRLVDKGASPRIVEFAERAMAEMSEPFDYAQAARGARLRPATRDAGLSLGDRACLALAEALVAPVVTADKAWATLKLGVPLEIRVIR